MNKPNNPRRPPAHMSVSLRHSRSPPPHDASSSPQPMHPSQVPSSNQANPPSSADSNLEIRKESSGESSNAEKWFERSNNDVQAHSQNIADLEPPFFLKNSSSSETPPDVVDSNRVSDSALPPNMLSYRSALLPMDTQGSSSEDFRSVIDDLTVENRRLKRRLRRFEKLHDAHLKEERLFEIRMPGLPPQKKRELEDTLRKFALSLDVSPPTYMSSGYAGSTPAALERHRTVSSHDFADSAYVSNAASGRGSGQQSLAPSAEEQGTRKTSKHTTSTSRSHDIHSYLHDIPSMLLPRQTVAMTEKSKKKLVVRRLEQIFAGKGAALSGHQQPLQQQEVSQSAARADRIAIEATGQQAKAEGVREARIMSKGEENMQVVKPAGHTKTAGQQVFASRSSPDQRPTRPLDLDLYRAQVPQDNIEYIRHLGFSPADFGADERPDDHGYVYLNVLANMAQLHTLNVTTDFVKKSVAEHSKKLMLSRDGRKVRWKGGQEVTKTSSDGSPVEGTPDSVRGLAKSGRERVVLDRTHSSGTSSASPSKASRAGSSNKLAYVPLFFHEQDSADDDMSSDEQATSWGSPQQEQVYGNSPDFTSAGMRTIASKRRRGDDGPIIFYSKAKFCTDLSGDPDPIGTPQQPSIIYNTAVANPVGVAAAQFVAEDVRYLGRGGLSTAPPQTDQMDVDSSSADSDSDGEPIRFSPRTASVAALNMSSPTEPDFEVTGLGGVQPSDHFKIEIQSRRKSHVDQAKPNGSHFVRKRVYSQRIRELLENRQVSMGSSSPAIEEEVVAMTTRELPASALPEPASLFVSSPNGDDSDDEMADDSDADDSISDSEDDLDRAPSAVPQMLHFSSQSSDGEEESDDDSSSDGSVDFLAAVRQVDPKAVHEREREYDANMAERLAEEIPAGSSAATAGGGSGFNTPAVPIVGADGKTSSATKRKPSDTIAPIIKKARIRSGGSGEATVAGASET